MLTAKIDLADSGTVVAAITGKKIRVLSYTIVAAGAVTAIWKSGTTALSGAMSMITGVPIHSSVQPNSLGDYVPVLQTAAGEALVVTLSSGVQVSGHLTYVLVG